MTPQKFLDEFGTLAEAKGGVKKLRELILQLAVRGKLVEQNDGDEPASALVEAAAETKLQLIADKRLRKHDIVDDPDRTTFPHP